MKEKVGDISFNLLHANKQLGLNIITFSVLMLEKINLHQNGVEFNFLFIGMASEPAISFRINPRIREDSKGVATTGLFFRISHQLESSVGNLSLSPQSESSGGVLSRSPQSESSVGSWKSKVKL